MNFTPGATPELNSLPGLTLPPELEVLFSTGDKRAEVLGFIDIPSKYMLVSIAKQRHNKAECWVLRFGPHTVTALGGEHVTVVLEASSLTLLGYTRLDSTYAARKAADETSAKRIATQFIARVAPDLVGGLELLWVKPHDETILVKGQSLTVHGMKVKMRQTNGCYVWVIVGDNAHIITFERDIIWNNDMSRRDTAKWLHDDWLKENE